MAKYPKIYIIRRHDPAQWADQKYYQKEPVRPVSDDVIMEDTDELSPGIPSYVFAPSRSKTTAVTDTPRSQVHDMENRH